MYSESFPICTSMNHLSLSSCYSSSIYISTTTSWLFAEPLAGGSGLCRLGRRGGPCGQFIGSPNLSFQTYQNYRLPPGPSEITAFIAMHLSEIYCLGNMYTNHFKSSQGESFTGFLTIHPDRHTGTTSATDRGSFFQQSSFSTNGLLAVKSS